MKQQPPRVCVVCGAIEGDTAVEVFGVIDGIEMGCSACIGVSHFPWGVREVSKEDGNQIPRPVRC
jgi:hypothetical protein